MAGDAGSNPVRSKIQEEAVERKTVEIPASMVLALRVLVRSLPDQIDIQDVRRIRQSDLMASADRDMAPIDLPPVF